MILLTKILEKVGSIRAPRCHRDSVAKLMAPAWPTAAVNPPNRCQPWRSQRWDWGDRRITKSLTLSLSLFCPVANPGIPKISWTFELFRDIFWSIALGSWNSATWCQMASWLRKMCSANPSAHQAWEINKKRLTNPSCFCWISRRIWVLVLAHCHATVEANLPVL